MASSFVLLICCLHVSSWDTIAGGLSSVTNTNTSRTYFVMWYCIGVLLLMKVITSFFISAFVLKLGTDQNFDMQRGKSDRHVNDDDNGPADDIDKVALQVKKKTIISLGVTPSQTSSSLLQDLLVDDGQNRENGETGEAPYLPERASAVVEKAAPQDKKRLSELSVRYFLAVGSMLHLRELLRENGENQGRQGENSALSNRTSGRRYAVNFENTRALTAEDMGAIVSRMHGNKNK
jgi:hypothetical protein